jgi:hypothetical protein
VNRKTAEIQPTSEHASTTGRSGRLRVLGWVAALAVSLAVWAVVVFVVVLVFG